MTIGIGIAERFEFDAFRGDILAMADCVELMTNGRATDDVDWIDAVHRSYQGKRIHLHSTALSIASAELDFGEVAHIAELCRRYRPDTLSDHLSFRTAGDVHLENFVPPLLNPLARELVHRNVETVQQACGMRLDLENVTHLIGNRDHLLRERDFLMDLCGSCGCGMVFDVNNLFIDSQNYKFDVLEYVAGLNFDHVATFHVAGFAVDRDGQYVDTHMERINDDVLVLLGAVLAKLPGDADVLLERDNSSATRLEVISEMTRIRQTAAEVDHPEPADCCGVRGNGDCTPRSRIATLPVHRRLPDLPL